MAPTTFPCLDPMDSITYERKAIPSLHWTQQRLAYWAIDKVHQPRPHMQYFQAKMCSMPLCKSICLNPIKSAPASITKEHDPQD